MITVKHISCPDYEFDDLDIDKVSKCIDDSLTSDFSGKDIVLRAVQSEKHAQSRDTLVQTILENGTDRTDIANRHEYDVSDRQIDIFGLLCRVESGANLSRSILEGFHKWKPMSLEKPQRKADIWIVYDAAQLSNVEYNHSYYHVKARDGYVFNNPKDKQKAIIGLLVID